MLPQRAFPAELLHYANVFMWIINHQATKYKHSHMLTCRNINSQAFKRTDNKKYLEVRVEKGSESGSDKHPTRAHFTKSSTVAIVLHKERKIKQKS